MAKVNSKGQIITRATAVAQHTQSTINGNYHEAYTGQITLTDANETGIIYVNPEINERILIVDKVFIEVWPSTGGTGSGTYRYYKNPTITGGTIIVPANTNFEKPDSLDGTYLRSLTTMTGGTVWWIGQFEAPSSIVINEEKFCIPKGYSFGISITAPAGNTSMIININIATYTIDTELLG